MKYACYLKDAAKNRMIPLKSCKLFEHEYQAKWFCIMNPEYTFKELVL